MGEVFIQFTLLRERKLACACLPGKLIHALAIGFRKLPTKQDARRSGRQRVIVGSTNHAVPDASSTCATCYFAHQIMRVSTKDVSFSLNSAFWVNC